MKAKNTLFFAIFVAAIVGYTIYDYSKIKYANIDELESTKLFPFEKLENLKEFKLTNNDKIIFLKKKSALWQFMAPIQYPGDQEFINSIVSLLDEPVEELASVDNQAIFGQASISIGFKFSSGEYKDILVSSQSTSDGQVYIQDIKTKKMYTTKADWLNISKKNIFDYRWKYLFLLKENIRQISFTKNFNKSYSFNYDPENKQWPAVAKNGQTLTDKKMAQFLSELMSIKVYRFVSESKSAAILKDYSLDKPEIGLEFSFENSALPNWGLDISAKTKGVFYATFINRSQIFELKEDDINKIKKYLNDLN